jgi:hypothetical protein
LFLTTASNSECDREPDDSLSHPLFDVGSVRAGPPGPRTTDNEENTMRFLMTTRPTDSEPDENLYTEMGKFVEELSASGVLLATGGLEPGGMRVSSFAGEITVTDGPFPETKEAVAGFALVEVGSREEAIEVARRFRAIVGDGESIIQQVFGP